MITITLDDIDGNPVEAKVGDYILEWCPIAKRLTNTRIEGIKKGFKTDGKLLTKPNRCRFIRSGAANSDKEE